MNARTFLEMTHNPFTPPRTGFFKGADRQNQLDQITHLSQWSRRLLLVVGPFGIGKSTLYRELGDHFPDAVALSGTAVTDPLSVLQAIGRKLGVALQHVAAVEDAIAVLKGHLEERARATQPLPGSNAAEDTYTQGITAILVDDAQLLEFATLVALLKLVAETQVRLVLFAEATAITNVTRAASQAEVDFFEIRLEGFSDNDVRGYLEWRFAQAQYRGRLPFTDDQVGRIAQRSGGNPNVIDFMANELLADIETGEYKQEPARFPRRHLALAGVLLALVVLAYMLYQQPAVEEVAPPQQIVEPTDRAPIDPAPIPTQVATLEAATEEAPIDDMPTVANEVVVEAEVEPVDVVDESEATIDAPVQEEPLQAAPAPVENIVDQTEQESSTVEVQSEPETPVVASPIPVVESSSQSDVNGGAWLLRQNGEHYTMQLMTLSKRDGGVALIGRQDDPDEFALVPTIRNGQNFFVLTYGVFSDRASGQRPDFLVSWLLYSHGYGQ